MYINNEDFEKWMQKLSKKLSEIGQDLKSLINIKEVPFFMIGHKTYYRVNDVRSFVREHMDFQTYQEFDKKHPTDDKDKEPE